MNSLFELEKERAEAQKRYRAKQKKLQAQKDVIEEQLKRMKYPHIIKYLNKLGKEIVLSKKIKGAVGFEVMGPFGFGNETSIYFYSEKKNKDGDPKTLAGATFVRRSEGYGLKDYSNRSTQYPKGSIGEMNGFNYGTIEITEDMTIDWFVRFAKKAYNK